MLTKWKATMLIFLYILLHLRGYNTLSRTGLELYLTPTRYNFKDSLEKCRQEGMVLAQPRTKTLVDFSINFLKTTNFSFARTSWVWVDLMRDGDAWQWGDNSVFELGSEWTPGEPSGGIDEDCAGLRDTGFYDNACSLSRNSLCQRQIPSVGEYGNVFSVDNQNCMPAFKPIASLTVPNKLKCFLRCLQTENCESCVLETVTSSTGFLCLLYDGVYTDKDMETVYNAEYYVKYFPHN